MADRQDIHAAEAPQDQPTMELLEGAEAAPAARSSLAARVVRGSLYGVLLLSGSALLAISAVPELANYVSFIPDDRASGTCHLSAGSAGTCATLDVAALKNIEGTPCCASAAVALEGSGCAKSQSQCEAFAAVAAEAGGCCLKAVAAETAACCAKGVSTESVSTETAASCAKSAAVATAACCEKGGAGCEKCYKGECPDAVATASAETSEEQPLDEASDTEASDTEASDTVDESLE
jgi:hypothetical protein